MEYEGNPMFHRPLSKAVGLLEGSRCNLMRVVDQFCVNLVEKAATMEPVIGREREIETVLQILCRKQ